MFGLAGGERRVMPELNLAPFPSSLVISLATTLTIHYTQIAIAGCTRLDGIYTITSRRR
jgi:hypothetical protein